MLPSHKSNTCHRWLQKPETVAWVNLAVALLHLFRSPVSSRDLSGHFGLNRKSRACHRRSTYDPGYLLRTLTDSGSPAASHKSKRSTSAHQLPSWPTVFHQERDPCPRIHPAEL